MNRRRLFALFVVAAMLGFASTLIPATAQDKEQAKKEADKKETPAKPDPKETKPPEVKPPEVKPEPPKTDGNPFAWKAFDADAEGKYKTFYQELYTDTNQNMSVMGMKIDQKQEQYFYVSWTPEKKDDKGNWVVTQEIVDVKMTIDIGGNKIEYNSLNENQPSNPMTDFFNKLRKLKLKYHISPNFTVEAIDGRAEFVKELGGANPQMEPLLKQILSEDALKQMAEPTWAAVPTKAVKEGDTWTKSSKLDLGPIGQYNTDYTYKWAKSDKGMQTIDVKADLKYSPPMAKSGAGLPFVIVPDGTTLKSKEGKGAAIFDSAKGRIASSDMKMELEGKLVIEVSGMKTTVDLIQTQNATVKTMDGTDWKPKKS